MANPEAMPNPMFQRGPNPSRESASKDERPQEPTDEQVQAFLPVPMKYATPSQIAEARELAKHYTERAANKQMWRYISPMGILADISEATAGGLASGWATKRERELYGLEGRSLGRSFGRQNAQAEAQRRANEENARQQQPSGRAPPSAPLQRPPLQPAEPMPPPNNDRVGAASPEIPRVERSGILDQTMGNPEQAKIIMSYLDGDPNLSPEQANWAKYFVDHMGGKARVTGFENTQIPGQQPPPQQQQAQYMQPEPQLPNPFAPQRFFT